MDPARQRPIDRPTRWPFPDEDPAIAALAPRDRQILANVWTSRIRSEAIGVQAFEYVVESLGELRAPDEIVGLARRAVDDEARHAEICRRVASAYRGAEVPAATPPPLRTPDHGGAAPDLRRLLHLLGQCCFHETTGSVFLERCLALATGAMAHAALRELLADEIDHARIGWATLARTPAPVRAALGPWVRPLLEADYRVWSGGGDFPSSPALAAHGCPANAVAVEAAHTAARDLILPGLAAAGIDVAAGHAWLADVTR